jgi:hypothetical protein
MECRTMRTVRNITVAVEPAVASALPATPAINIPSPSPEKSKTDLYACIDQ